jgi:phosphoenolpyruvate carboxylase
MSRSTNGDQSPLSVDIHLLGDLLGGIIREQHGDEALALVESIRALAKARRTDPAADAQLRAAIHATDLHARRVLIKAFGNYFQLINIAEDQQRIRVLRQREAASRLDESIVAGVRELAAAGLSASDMRALLGRVRIRLVLTAHPSEAKRKEVLIKLRDIAEMMAVLETPNLLPREREHYKDAITRRIEQLWQIAPTRATRATVADEVDFGKYFLTSTIMGVTVDIYEELLSALAQVYPHEDWSDLPAVLQYASWIGGDRDGNPNVSPQSTLDTIRTHRHAVRDLYLSEVIYLRDRLTQATPPTVAGELLRDFLISDEIAARYPDEAYRQALDAIHDRLSRDQYATGDDLLADLQRVQHMLRRSGSRHSAGGTLDWLIRKVQVFGLHLVPLDIREDSRLNSAAFAEMLERYGVCSDYLAQPEHEKQELLTREIESPRPLFPVEPNFSDETNRIIDTWRMIARAHRDYGTHAINTVIASMSRQPSDVLLMLLYAREVGVADHVDLVPLFETVDDLVAAPEVMTALFTNPAYQHHLKKRLSASGSPRQQIMIGYSDSNKDGGYIASNWSLYRAQMTLSEVCRAYEVDLELFHGRGGSIGRGGGPTNHAIRSGPPGMLRGEIKITEQGEVIAYRYSNVAIARRHLNQVIHAVLLAAGNPAQNRLQPDWLAIMDALTNVSRDAYRRFVYETTGFIDYWEAATPIRELADLPISSRPARRKKGGFESVRAIPWVFSWMQSRAIIPSWYGVGYALESFCNNHPAGLDSLKTMYQQWPFFQALIENVQLDVAKADMGIAALYSELVEDHALQEQIFTEITTEHERACHHICLVTDQQDLLDRTPVIKRSIDRRNPYVDPLNFIQVELLRQLRALSPESPDYRPLLREVLATINGIAAGMKTTG